MITSIVVAIGSLLILIAFIGIFIPVIPGGAFLSYISLLLWISLNPDTSSLGEVGISLPVLVIIGVLHLVAILIDFLIPFIGSKFFNFSKQGVWGSLIGMVIGLFLFPPLGVILGGIVGTFAGEIYCGRGVDNSLNITGYSVLLNITAFSFKLVLTVITSYYFFKTVFDFYY